MSLTLTCLWCVVRRFAYEMMNIWKKFASEQSFASLKRFLGKLGLDLLVVCLRWWCFSGFIRLMIVVWCWLDLDRTIPVVFWRIENLSVRRQLWRDRRRRARLTHPFSLHGCDDSPEDGWADRKTALRGWRTSPLPYSRGDARRVPRSCSGAFLAAAWLGLTRLTFSAKPWDSYGTVV